MNYLRTRIHANKNNINNRTDISRHTHTYSNMRKFMRRMKNYSKSIWNKYVLAQFYSNTNKKDLFLQLFRDWSITSFSVSPVSNVDTNTASFTKELVPIAVFSTGVAVLFVIVNEIIGSMHFNHTGSWGMLMWQLPVSNATFVRIDRAVTSSANTKVIHGYSPRKMFLHPPVWARITRIIPPEKKFKSETNLL